jgi:hypothetical protein
MHNPRSLAEPIPARAEVSLQQCTASDAVAGPPGVCAELDRHDIAVVLQPIHEWGGYRYTNASDAIAAAKRGAK